MPTTTSTPRIEIKLIKTMARNPAGLAERYKGSRREWDLTPFLGDQGSVRTSKSLRSPEGSFAIVFPDQADSVIGDSLYSLIEAQDLVEIRMGREAGKLPIVMRGFIQHVSRSEQISEDGSPHRFVTLTGYDYGAVFRWCQVIWAREYLAGDNPYLMVFRYLDWAGISDQNMIAGEFVGQLVEKVANRFLKIMDTLSASSAAQAFKFDTDSVKTGRISPFYVSGHEGDMWSLICAVGDLQWNEFFVEDREDGPWAIYRPMPFRNAYGQDEYLLPDAKDPGTVKVTAGDVRAIDIGHGAERTANWFEVQYPMGCLPDPGWLNADMLRNGSFGLTPEESENSDYRLYGPRRMTAVTMQTSIEAIATKDGRPYAERAEYRDLGAKWWNDRRDQLVAMNKDNSVFEEGTITLRGNPAVMAGKYLHLTRGSLEASFYVVGVQHACAPFGDWTTTCQVERGTGFISRMKSAGAPAWLEGRAGAA